VAEESQTKDSPQQEKNGREEKKIRERIGWDLHFTKGVGVVSWLID
jgi:hypothetical protein